MTEPGRPLRVLYLSQWFDPEPVMKGAAFIRGLRDVGFDVAVCTGFPNYPSGRLAPGYRLRAHQREMLDGMPVDRVWLFPSHDASSLGRALNYLSFFVSALLFLLSRGRRFDAVYVYHPPITVGLAAALAGAVTRTPFVLDVQDLWPDSVAASGMGGTGALAKALGPLCRLVYRRAGVVVAQSDGIRAALADRGVPEAKLETIFNWADETGLRHGSLAPQDHGFPGRFNLVYAGNLGVVQGLETLVRAAALAVAREPAIQLHLIGDGVAASDLAALKAELGIDAVRLHPPVPKDRIGAVLAAADVLVVSLRPDPLFALTLPSKLQFYLGVGRPILGVVEGEAARVVTEAGAGVVARPGDVEGLADAMVAMARTPREMLDAMGERGREAYLRRFAFSKAIAATARVIERAALRDRRHPPAIDPAPPTN